MIKGRMCPLFPIDELKTILFSVRKYCTYGKIAYKKDWPAVLLVLALAELPHRTLESSSWEKVFAFQRLDPAFSCFQQELSQMKT